jgi:hypothetical protein
VDYRASMRTSLLAPRLLAGALAAVLATTSLVSPARAAEAVATPSDDTEAPPATALVHATDDDPRARFELFDERGGITTWVGDREFSARPGRYVVRVAHGGVLDETEFYVDGETNLRGRAESRVGRYVGIPVLVVGSIATVSGLLALLASSYPCGDCAPSPSFQQAHDRNAQSLQTTGGIALFVGLTGVVTGILLIASSHGSSVEARAREMGTASVRFDVGATASGGGFSLSGTF